LPAILADMRSVAAAAVAAAHCARGDPRL